MKTETRKVWKSIEDCWLGEPLNLLLKKCVPRKLRIPEMAMSAMHEGNTEEKNNGYVVFKSNIFRSAKTKGGGGRGEGRRFSARPPPFYTAGFLTDS
jgi:hypothetical protein